MTITHELVNVVVVGAGMGGAAFCYRLSQQLPAIRVVCLERGGWLQPAQMPATRPDFQRLALTHLVILFYSSPERCQTKPLGRLPHR